jgi:hypothetical protein
MSAAEEARHASREIRCECCGYGAVAERNPLRCPMCGDRSWRVVVPKTAVLLHTIMSAERAEWAMQKPSLVEWMAWRRYLVATRASSSAAYALIEEAAWTRLLDDLGQVESQQPSPGRSSVAEPRGLHTTADPLG